MTQATQTQVQVTSASTNEALRYPVGSVQYFIYVNFTRGKNRPLTPLYLPWVDTLNNFQVKKLTCVEHHKVACCHDLNGEKDYDGFIFAEDNATHKSGRWFNQYPTASYSQTSNDRDFCVHQDLSEEEILASLDDEIWQDYEEVSITLSRIFRSIHRLKNEEDRPFEAELLSEFADKIIQTLKNDFCLDVVKKPFVVAGREIKGHYEVTLSPIV